jgi:hypothetical protein
MGDRQPSGHTVCLMKHCVPPSFRHPASA